MTSAAFVQRTPHVVRALAAIHGAHPGELAEIVRGRIDCPRCRGTLTYTLSPARRCIGACTKSNCLAFDQG